MVGLLIPSAVGSAMTDATNKPGPVPPSQDPFYTAPLGFEGAKPGEVLRIREAPGNLTSVVGANCSAAYNILFRTTDARYKPSWAVTTLLVPVDGKGDALVSYQTPYNTLSVDDSPSYTYYKEVDSDVKVSLAQGWYVNVPDHEGPYAAFGAEVGQGYVTLDSVRAAFSARVGLRDDARYVIWGYAGGAVASEFAAELQVKYAPELKFSGAALGGQPTSMVAVWERANGGPYAGFVPLSGLGLTKLFPEARECLLSDIKEDKVGKFNSVENMGPKEALELFAGEDVWSYFKSGEAVLDGAPLKEVVQDNCYMGYHGVPQMPVFMYHAIHDELEPIANVEALAKKYCGAGASILLERNTVSNHSGEAVKGQARAVAYLKSALAGTLEGDYPVPGCEVRTVTVEAE